MHRRAISLGDPSYHFKIQSIHSPPLVKFCVCVSLGVGIVGELSTRSVYFTLVRDQIRWVPLLPSCLPTTAVRGMLRCKYDFITNVIDIWAFFWER